MFVVPHPAVESAAATWSAAPAGAGLRAPLEARGARTVVVAPGDINEAKQLDALLAAVATLPDDVHVARRRSQRIEGYDAVRGPALAASAGGCPLETDVTDDDFLAWLGAADIVVDLRHPHRGEVAGRSLARCRSAARRRVGDRHLPRRPEGTVVAVAPGATDPVELAVRIASSRRRRGRRDADGRGRARTRRGGPRLGGHRARVRAAIVETLRLVRDPVRKAEARWAGALADIGVGEPELRAATASGTRGRWRASRAECRRAR